MSDIINCFPGYEYRYNPDLKRYENMYRGTNLGRGGYVYQKEGMYTNVALIDIQSMHPSSIIAMNYFGEYTKRYKDILDTRILIKHGKLEEAKQLFDGKLAKYLTDQETAGALSQALKIALNSCYGLTSASFDNAFRDNRNVNNIVALRGALFMRTLQDEVASRGYEIIHIRTDSAKIPNASPDIIKFCVDFAAKYGYTFEFEGCYDRMCLVDKTNYIAKYMSCDRCERIYGTIPGDNRKAEKKNKMWTATGAKFQHPFVYKTLFSREPVTFNDLCETKEVKSSMYLDFNEQLPDVSQYETDLLILDKIESGLKAGRRIFPEMTRDELRSAIKVGHNYKFIGKNCLFTPVVSGSGGGELVVYDGVKYSAVTGTKGYRWLESEVLKTAGLSDKIDLSYYRNLADDCVSDIKKYGDYEWFVSDDDPPSESNHPLDEHHVPWLMPCKDPAKNVCEECDEYDTCPYIHDSDDFKKR